VLHYQPIFALADRRIAGFEAWSLAASQTRPASAGEFLPLAEGPASSSRSIAGLVTRHTSAHGLAAEVSVDPRFWMSVNLSSSDLSDPDLLKMISSVVASSGIEPSDLVVEVTESVLLNDSKETMDFLTGLKELGLGLALDDFGTGFASISYVRRFPFDHLKLDISFIAELPESERSMTPVKDISRLATSMGMVGIAERIERQERWDALLELGWDYGQGFLFSRRSTPSTASAARRPAVTPVVGAEEKHRPVKRQLERCSTSVGASPGMRRSLLGVGSWLADAITSVA